MTDQQELDRLLGAFFADGVDELADRVIEASLDQIDHTRQQPALRLPRSIRAMPMVTRLAAAAVIGVIAVGGGFYLSHRSQPAVVGGPGASASATPAITTVPTPVVTPTPKPSPMGLTGPLGEGRQIHTATTLADGRVIVAGGIDASDLPLASATLYDPATDTFGPAGAMGAARAFFTATMLPSGRVLIAGGGPAQWSKPGPDLESAELYDPATGTFSPTGSMTTTRQAHTATLLRDGRVLIAGGTDSGDHAIATAELYDPQTGTFSRTGSMTTARSFHTATLLPDGRVLITGGSPSGWSWTTSLVAPAEIYDPTTGTFTPTGSSMTTPRAWHTATLLADGRVLVTGGLANNASELVASELFDPVTGRFADTGPMTVTRTHHTATLLADGRVLVVGGGGDYANREFQASAETYDPSAGTFRASGSMAEARTYHQANLLADGRVLITGGYGDLAPLPSAELYDPTTGTFGPAGTGG